MKRTIFLLTLLASVTMSTKAYERGDTFNYGGLEYEVVTSTTVDVIGCLNPDIKSVTIPSSVNGFTVDRIGDFAFNGCSNLESVEIPHTVF